MPEKAAKVKCSGCDTFRYLLWFHRFNTSILTVMAIKALTEVNKCLFICNGGSCLRKQADELTNAVRMEIKINNLNDSFHTVRTRCIGRCEDAPVVMCAPDNIWFKHVQPHDAGTLIQDILTDGMKQSLHYLYTMGEKDINSPSIPTKYRKKKTEE